MDKSFLHLIIYIRGTENMIYAPPLALIPISSKYTISAFGIFGQRTNSMTANLPHYRAISLLIEVTCDQDLWHRRETSVLLRPDERVGYIFHRQSDWADEPQRHVLYPLKVSDH